MNLHGQIMNIAAQIPDGVAQCKLVNQRTSYLLGHREARHAAAELALLADEEAARLLADNAALLDRLAWIEARASNAHPSEFGMALAQIHGQAALAQNAALSDRLRADKEALRKDAAVDAVTERAKAQTMQYNAALSGLRPKMIGSP